MNKNEAENSFRRIITIWLFLGLVMVYFQIIIGGITRLTGSGLSITEWDILTGTFPPLTESGWVTEFEKYKITPQYQKINLDMELGSIFSSGTFKFIYFWEYLHRLWARIIGFVFLIPFIFFSWKGQLPGSLIKRLGIVVGLAALAATFGWIMVASGLINRPWVNSYKLSLHLCIGIGVFIALWWAYIRYVHKEVAKTKGIINRYIGVMFGLLILQIFLGGVMSGTKAALFINTWPDLNGEVIPSIIVDTRNWSFDNFNYYENSGFLVSLVQFLHRSVAYLITILSIFLFIRLKRSETKSRVLYSFYVFILLIFLQVLVGILTLIGSIGIIPVYLGVIHQALAVLVLASFVLHIFYVSHQHASE